MAEPGLRPDLTVDIPTQETRHPYVVRLGWDEPTSTAEAWFGRARIRYGSVTEQPTVDTVIEVLRMRPDIHHPTLLNSAVFDAEWAAYYGAPLPVAREQE